MNTMSAVSAPRSIGDVLDGAFRIFRAHFVPLILTAAAFLAPLSIISGLLTGSYMTSMQDMATVAGSMDSSGSDALLGDMLTGMLSTVGAMLLLMVVMVLFTGLVTLTLTGQVLALLAQQPLTFGQAVRRALGRFWAWLGMMLAQYGAVAGVTLVLVLMLVVASLIVTFGVAFVGAALELDDGALSGIGFAGAMVGMLCLYLLLLLFLLVPTLYLSARWIAALPGLVDQKLGPLQSLRNSWRLTKRLIWRSVFFLILMGVLNAVVTVAPMMVLQQIMLALLPFDPATTATISTALTSLVSVLWQPIYAAAIVLYYFDLRVRQEGYDLDLRIQALEAGAQGVQVQP